MTNDVTGWKGQPHADGGRATWNQFGEILGQGSGAIDQVTIDPIGRDRSMVEMGYHFTCQGMGQGRFENQGVLLTEMNEGPGVVRVFSSEAFRTANDGMGGGYRIAYRPILILWPSEAN